MEVQASGSVYHYDPQVGLCQLGDGCQRPQTPVKGDTIERRHGGWGQD